MFDALKDMTANAKALNGNVILREVLDDRAIQTEVIELNQQQLEGKHVRGDGGAITRVYSKVSQRLYGKPNTPIILKDTGAFYASMKFKNNANDFVLSGDTDKETENGVVDLQGYINGNPMGLTNESIEEINIVIQPKLQSLVLENLRK